MDVLWVEMSVVSMVRAMVVGWGELKVDKMVEQTVVEGQVVLMGIIAAGQTVDTRAKEMADYRAFQMVASKAGMMAVWKDW